MKWRLYKEPMYESSSSDKRLAKVETFTEDEEGNIKSRREGNWQFPGDWDDDDIIDWFRDKYDAEGNWSRYSGSKTKVSCSVPTARGFRSYNLTILK